LFGKESDKKKAPFQYQIEERKNGRLIDETPKEFEFPKVMTIGYNIFR